MSNDSSARLADVLAAWVRSADPGARLPSTRAVVAEHGVSPVTVQKALRVLEARGLVETRPGVGTFVRSARATRPLDLRWQTGTLGAPRAAIPSVATAMRTVPADAIALHSGYPDAALLPERLVRAALVRAARRDTAVQRPLPAGLPDLRAWFAAELAEASPASSTPPTFKDVLVVPGSQSGLAAIFRSLVPPGGPLLLEAPTYWGAISAAAQAGVRAVPVPAGPDGPDPEALARSFDETGARAFYAQPSFANPTGWQWSGEVARDVLQVVRDRRAFLVEDDWAHDFGIDAPARPVAAHDDAGHVIYIRSLTKSVSPSVRVAAVMARGPVRERILADAGAESMYVSGLLQEAALDVVTQPGWRTHLRALRHQLRARRDLLLESLADHAPQVHVERVPPGGLNVWARLPDGTDAGAVAARCEARGLVIAPGDEWFSAEPSGPYVRLNYAGADPGAYPQAARILGEELASEDG